VIRPWPFIVLGLVLAAMTAGMLTGVEFWAFGRIATALEDRASDTPVAYGLLVAAVATPAYLIGLIFPGVPVWLWLHEKGWRSYRTAALAAGVGASVAGIAMTAGAAGWSALMVIVWIGIPGAAAGLVLRGVAYGKPRPPRPRPVPPS
jgi:hypothetical protein